MERENDRDMDAHIAIAGRVQRRHDMAYRSQYQRQHKSGWIRASGVVLPGRRRANDYQLCGNQTPRSRVEAVHPVYTDSQYMLIFIIE